MHPHSTIVSVLYITLSLLASFHVVLFKRDSRSAVGWIGLIWLSPFLGAVLYYLLGINRIRRRAQVLRPQNEKDDLGPRNMPVAIEGVGGHLVPLARLGAHVDPRPLLSGNRIEPLVLGDEAYPAMLAAIDRAKKTIGLSTYIFDRDEVGAMFVEALKRAVGRGVDVRVLIDDIGLRYTIPSITGPLKRAGVRVARFLPSWSPKNTSFINLRNHRKMLLVDSTEAFVGGMNIRKGHWLALKPKSPIQDVQFRLQGPVVAQVYDLFVRDWGFATRENLSDHGWGVTYLPSVGSEIARLVPDGPDGDFEKTRWTFMGAVSCARESIRIVTPYFLPDNSLINALNAAAMRGIRVEIVLPAKNNLPWFQWATQAILPQLLERGCRVWLSAPPFDHSKMMIVDGAWVLFGSSNWDARSLRLNFEVNIECYSNPFAASLDALFEKKRAAGTELTLEALSSRRLPTRIRDGVARLFSPYL